MLMRSLIVALALLWAASAWAQPTVAQSAIDSDVSLDTVSFSGTPTVGCWVVVGLGTNAGSTPGDLAVSDNQGNTYTQQRQTGVAGLNSGLWTAPITTSSGTFTVDVDDLDEEVNGLAIIAEVCPAGGETLSYDGAEASGDDESTSVLADMPTTTNADDLLIAFFTVAGASTITATNSYTITQENEADGRSGAMMTRSVTATGDYDATATLGTSRFWSIVAIAITSSGGGGGATAPRLTLLGVGQ